MYPPASIIPRLAIRPLCQSLQAQLRPAIVSGFITNLILVFISWLPYIPSARGDAAVHETQHIPRLLKALRSTKSETRAQAASALGDLRIDSPEVSQGLSDALRDSVPFVREAAAEALQKLGPKAIPYLTKALRFPEPFARELAVFSLEHFGAAARSATPDLIRALRDPDLAPRLAAIHVLARIEAKDAIGAITELLNKQEDVSIRRRACEALGHFGSAAKDAVPALIDEMIDEVAGDLYLRNYWPVSEAACALAEIGHPAATALSSLLADQRYATASRAAAAWALGEMSGKLDGASATKVVNLLARTLDQRDVRLKQMCLVALGEFGVMASMATPTISRLLRDTSGNSRVLAAWALFQIAPDNALTVPALIASLHEKDPGVRSVAAQKLSLMGSVAKAARPELARSLNDTDPTVRLHSVYALQAIGLEAKSVLSALRAIARDDPNRFVREAATKAVNALDK